MDLYEHQARQLFEEHGILVPRAEVTDSPGRARDIARGLGGRVVVKAQVRTGGRGKAGGVRLAEDPDAAERTAREILGMNIKGHPVRTVMLAQPVDIESEFYVSYVLDRAAGRFLAIASAEGGTEIEEVAALRPEAVARVPVDPAEGVTPQKAAEIVRAAGLPPRSADVLVRLWQVLIREDALLVEVNPLVRTAQGQLMALDGKVTLDGNARYRQARWDGQETSHDDPLEAAAAAKGLNYVKLDGEVGVIGNGAGLVMSTLDVVAGEWRPPRQLPRHRRRGLRADHVRRAVRRPVRPRRQVRPRQRLRRHHRLRRRRRRHRAGAGRRTADQTARGPARRQQRGPGPRRPRGAGAPPGAPGRHHGRRRPPRRPTGPHQLKERDMAVFLTEESRILVQGMTGAEGMRHTRRMLAAGTNVVGGVNPRKAGLAVAFDVPGPEGRGSTRGPSPSSGRCARGSRRREPM